MINQLLKLSQNKILDVTIVKKNGLKKISINYRVNGEKEKVILSIEELKNFKTDYSIYKFINPLNTFPLPNFENVDESTFSTDSFKELVKTFEVTSDNNLHNYTKKYFKKVLNILDDLNADNYIVKWKNINKIYIDLLDNPFNKNVKLITESHFKESNRVSLFDIDNNKYVLGVKHNLKRFIVDLFEHQKVLMNFLETKNTEKSHINKDIMNQLELVKNENNSLKNELKFIKEESLDIKKFDDEIIKSLTTENNNYFEALSFYAIPETYEDFYIGGKKYSPINKDKGKEAREVLNAKDLKTTFVRNKEIIKSLEEKIEKDKED